MGQAARVREARFWPGRHPLRAASWRTRWRTGHQPRPAVLSARAGRAGCDVTGCRNHARVLVTLAWPRCSAARGGSRVACERRRVACVAVARAGSTAYLKRHAPRAGGPAGSQERVRITGGATPGAPRPERRRTPDRSLLAGRHPGTVEAVLDQLSSEATDQSY